MDVHIGIIVFIGCSTLKIANCRDHNSKEDYIFETAFLAVLQQLLHSKQKINKLQTISSKSWVSLIFFLTSIGHSCWIFCLDNIQTNSYFLTILSRQHFGTVFITFCYFTVYFLIGILTPSISYYLFARYCFYCDYCIF